MSKQIKTGILALFLILTVSISGFTAETPLTDLQNGVAAFSESLAKSLPLNASIGLNWADAYIGKLFPSAPPHFGVGGAFGITTMELPKVKDLAGFLGYNIPFDVDKMILPAYTVEARIGGFFLPFDLGVKFGKIPETALWGTSLKIDYLLVGGEIRYALLDKPILPKISLGVGLNYLKGGFGADIGARQEFTYNDGSPHTLAIEKPALNFRWETTSLDFVAQISMPILIITPYAGLGASYSWSNSGYSIDADISYGTPGSTAAISQQNINSIKAFLKSAGLEDMEVSESGISSMAENNAFNFRIFGGLSFNLTVIKIDLTALYSVRDTNFGGSLGLRFQL